MAESEFRIDDIPAQQALEALLPMPGTAFAMAFLLAAFRRDARDWLGGKRIKLMEQMLGDDAFDAFETLDRAPRPPAVLGDAAQWLGCRVPILHQKRIVWTELFWRPDPRLSHRGNGSFALRMQLPKLGAVEIRGRMEEFRLDAILHSEQLSRPLAYDLKDDFRAILAMMGLSGGLSVKE